ncbi:MAG: FGGY family carbohydrate kinase [Candidatus Omnitrophica bacterium]|nr:FGGY family carbohydrate kinase [Candidatus Omnitrophota bacterium]
MEILAIDLGTTKVKGAIIRDREVIYKKSFVFPVDDKEGKKEVEEKILWKKIKQFLKDFFNFSKKIEKIGITSQAQTFIAIDENCRGLTNFIVWNDRRAQEEAQILNNKFPDFFKYSGLPQFIPELMICKILFLKRNCPEIYRRVYKFLLLNEWLILKLTGELFGDENNAGMSGIYNIKEKRFTGEILNFLSIGENKFPNIFPTGCHFSFLKQELMDVFKIQKKVEVFSSGNDQTSAAIGSGIDKNSCVINLGTAFVLYTLIDELPEKIEKTQMCGIFPFGNYFLLSCDGDFGSRVKKGLRNEDVFEYLKQNLEGIEKYGKIEKFYVSGGYGKKFLKVICDVSGKRYQKNVFYKGQNMAFYGIEKIIKEAQCTGQI